jgi:hypothetical protein
MTVELIPVIELTPAYTEALDDSQLSAFGLSDRVGVYGSFVHALGLTNDAWQHVTTMHISDIPLEDSCAIFGGYVLKVDSEIILYPQCCSTLAEIHYWQQILHRENVEHGKSVWLAEGHPSPEITLHKELLKFVCDEEWEDFDPKTMAEFEIDYSVMCDVITKTAASMQTLSMQLDRDLAATFGVATLKGLIWDPC